MCGSPDLAKESGTLQYRYGFIGKRLELEYPNSNDNVDKKFSITSSGSGKWHDRKINFEINNFTYSLSSYENMNIPEEDFSISIFKNRKIFRYLICIKNSIHDDTWILEDILK